jgi:hypothetical protein
MSDKWDFYFCTMGESLASIFLNFGVNDRIDQAPPNLVRICLHYKNPDDRGMPPGDEHEAVKVIEEQLSNLAEDNGDWYVGRVTVDGCRYFYIYSERSAHEWNTAINDLAKDSDYQIDAEFFEDMDHDHYKEKLYPGPDDLQVLGDMKVIKALKERGDDPEISRVVDHWIYFENKAAAADFIIWAEGDRFTEKPENSCDTDSGYCVRLVHQGTMLLNDITSHTIALNRKATEYGGEYDGWETQVQM